MLVLPGQVLVSVLVVLEQAFLQMEKISIKHI